MKERISSFIIACTLVFSCVAIPFIARPVPASASAEGMLEWEYMMHLWSLEGLFTHESANYYGGFQGYSAEQKFNSMSGLKNFFDGQRSDLHNWLLYHELIAESKVNEWWDNLKSGTLDLVSDVGSSVYDWLNSKSGEVAKQWQDGIPESVNRDKFIDGNYLSPDALHNYLYKVGLSYSRSGHCVFENQDGFTSDLEYFYQIPANRAIFPDRISCFVSGNNSRHFHYYYELVVSDSSGTAFWNVYYRNGNYDVPSDVINGICVDDKAQEKVQLPPTVDDLEKDKQLPSVIDTYGGNLPKPYRDPNNDDDGDEKEKPVPFVPEPINIPWSLIHGDGDGSGGVKIIIKDTDINSTKQFNYNEYKKLQIQIKKLSQTLNKILNLKQYNIQNNKEIGGKEKVLPFIQPDFHQAIDFKKKFPFSLPWDVLYIFKLFNESPEAPAVTIDYPVISKGSGWGGYTVITKPIDVDFNTDIWNKVAKVCRVMLFLLFGVGICWAFFVK